MKKLLAAAALTLASTFTLASEAKTGLDYEWGVISVNKIEDLNYLELEGGAGYNGFEFYGFYDFNDDSTRFSKVNFSYVSDDGLLAEITSKQFTTTDGQVFTDTFYGVGYKKVFDNGGFAKASLNSTAYDSYGVLSAASVPFYWDTSIDGWMDLVRQSNSHDFRGNIGIRKYISKSVYGRVASHWQYINGDADAQLHFQVGYQL